MFLTQSNYLIKIINKSGTLKDICWTGLDGFKLSFGTVTAHNGRKPIIAPTPPEPGILTLTKQANPSEDKLIFKWLSTFCVDDALDGSGDTSSGDTLVVTPKKTCQTDKLVIADRLEIYSIVPSGDLNFWSVDVTSKNTPSTNTLQLRYTSSNFMEFN